MLRILKKKATTSNIWRIIISIVVVAVLLAVTKFSILDVITGPAKIDITADPAAYEGKYVTIDAEYLLFDYIEHTTTTTRQSGSKTTSTNGYSYLAFQSVGEEGSEDSVWYFYSIYLNKSKQSEMSARIDQTFDYLNDNTGNTPPPEPVKITGVWNKMDSVTERYFRNSLSELGITESDVNQFYFYELDTKNIGGMNAPLFWVLMAVAAFMILFAVLSVISLFNNSYIKDIQEYLKKDTSVSMADIEADFGYARPISSCVWIGKRWTVYMAGNKAKILTNRDLIWGYYFRRTGRNSVSEMRLYDKNKHLSAISLSEKNTKEALTVYAAEQPQMIIGYDANLEKMYDKEFYSFLELKYNAAIREM